MSPPDEAPQLVHQTSSDHQQQQQQLVGRLLTQLAGGTSCEATPPPRYGSTSSMIWLCLLFTTATPSSFCSCGSSSKWLRLFVATPLLHLISAFDLTWFRLYRNLAPPAHHGYALVLFLKLLLHMAPPPLSPSSAFTSSWPRLLVYMAPPSPGSASSFTITHTYFLSLYLSLSPNNIEIQMGRLEDQKLLLLCLERLDSEEEESWAEGWTVMVTCHLAGPVMDL